MEEIKKLLYILIILLLLNITSVFAQSYAIKEPISEHPSFSLDTSYTAVAYYPLKEYYIDLTWDDLFFVYKYNKKEIDSQFDNELLLMDNNFNENFIQYHTKMLNELINSNIFTLIVENKSGFSINVDATIKYNDKLQIANDDKNLFFDNKAFKNNLANKKITSFILRPKLQEFENNKFSSNFNGEVKLTFTKVN